MVGTLSLRARITLLGTVVFAAVLAAAGFVMLRLQRDALTDNVEAAIRLRADDIGALLATGGLPASLDQSDGEVAGVQLVRGETVAWSTTNLADVAAISSLAPAAGETLIERRHDVPIDDEPFLVLARQIDFDGVPHTLYVAGSLDETEESADVLQSLLFTGAPFVIGFVALGTWLVVGRALAPVEAMRREVAAITLRHLGRRVPESGRRDEIDRLAATMNTMLERLEDGRTRLEQFVADASHELRSPLASLRAQLEVDATDGRNGATGDGLLAEVLRLQRLTDDLLALACADRELDGHRTLVDLDDIVIAEAERLRQATGRAIDLAGVSAGQVRGDAGQLLSAVRNVMDNACRHARSRVTVTLTGSGEDVVLTVADDGPGIPAAERERVFERFARLDTARSRDAGGTGLGLAITRAVVEAHDGQISIDPGYEAGARFVLRLPAADTAIADTWPRTGSR